ncbi:MAG: FAD-binding oxidoreductase [Actinomycetia bacterium]|nr:FAD-binding oxidoreductase [Actinomycetes bacterium]MCP4962007.1 FAD-binding oxidoreductase [Actinomycetes bacterium]
MKTLLDDLSAVLGAGLLLDEDQRVERARDTWSRSQIAITAGEPEVAPMAVCAPVNAAEMAEVVSICRAHKVPMIPRGGGSGVCGGVLASTDAVVLSTEHMTGLVSLSTDDLLATFGGGTNGFVAETMMAESGLTIGHWPQSIELSTVGGWVATRASGQYSTAYGNIEDMVYSLEAVLADGSVYHSRDTPRASAGPDLRQLLMGSEGTLGVVTEVTLSVREQPEPGVRQAFHFADFAAGLDAIRAVMRQGWRPPVARLYDGRESWRHFRDHMPKGNCMLIFLHEGPPGLAALQAAATEGLCGARGGVAAESEAVDTWFEHRNAVPTWDELLKQGIVSDTIEVAAPWSVLPRLYDDVVAALKAVPGVVAASGHSSHAYRSGANLYFTVAAIPEDLQRYGATYDTFWNVAMKATAALGVGVAHHHGIGRVRRDWMPSELGEAGVGMLRSVKRALDPEGLMNPGVLIP